MPAWHGFYHGMQRKAWIVTPIVHGKFLPTGMDRVLVNADTAAGLDPLCCLAAAIRQQVANAFTADHPIELEPGSRRGYPSEGQAHPGLLAVNSPCSSALDRKCHRSASRD